MRIRLVMEGELPEFNTVEEARAFLEKDLANSKVPAHVLQLEDVNGESCVSTLKNLVGILNQTHASGGDLTQILGVLNEHLKKVV